ncbi:hypothetical protein D3C85_1325630 [compost metagenome]
MTLRQCGHIQAIQMQFRALGQGAGGAGRVGVVLAQQARDEELVGCIQLAQLAAQPVQVLSRGLRL